MNWLLPDYIADVLPNEAVAIERLRRTLFDLFRGHGYELGAHRHNDRRSAPLSEYAAVCLFADSSRFQNQVGVSDSRSYSLYHLVLLNSLSFFSEITNQ